MNKQSGFSLIELVIAVAIIGILAAVAIPAYNDQTTTARRTDGQAFMLDIQAKLERHFFDNNGYPETLAGMTGYGAAEESPEGYYTVSLTGTDCTAGLCLGYTLLGTAQGGQLDDGNLTLLSNGTKSPADKW